MMLSKIGWSDRHVPPDKGCEVLGRKLTHEQWDDREAFSDSVEGLILLK